MEYQNFNDISGRYGFFQSINLPPELFIPIGLLEVIGGLAILFGILTRIASALFIIEMICAILTAKLSKGFIGGNTEMKLMFVRFGFFILFLKVN
jgi:putative oxidoreductase